VTSSESVSSHCNPLSKSATRTVRASVLAWGSVRRSLVRDQIWERKRYLPIGVPPTQNDHIRGAVCAGISVSDSDVPSGYTLIGVKRIDGDCFAMFRTNDTGAAPTVGGGFADLSGQV
jgi:hypothetical protein